MIQEFENLSEEIRGLEKPYSPKALECEECGEEAKILQTVELCGCGVEVCERCFENFTTYDNSDELYEFKRDRGEYD